jgi:hypothetical protein
MILPQVHLGCSRSQAVNMRSQPLLPRNSKYYVIPCRLSWLGHIVPSNPPAGYLSVVPDYILSLQTLNKQADCHLVDELHPYASLQST